jgi:hypothetical protein
MHAVINRLRLKRPIDPEVFAAARRDLVPRVARVAGIAAFHVVQVADDELVVVILGDDGAALERLRDEAGNAWMTENITPHLAAGTERQVGESVVAYTRA